MRDRISITRVAKEAKVSIQTVSRVINEQSGVAMETRERILHVIKTLGYYPSRAAKAMRGASRTLGIVGFGLDLYGPSRALMGAQRQASERHYGVVLELVQNPQHLDVRAIFETMLSNHVDGVVWCIPEIGMNNREVIIQLETLPIPIVFTDTSPDLHDLLVYCDNFLGGQMATRHLIQANHRVIGLITGPMTYFSAIERKRGWQSTLHEYHLQCDESLTVEGDWQAQSGAEGLKQLLKQNPDMTAVFACNDQMALGVLHTAAQMGLRVPHDLAVVGYDDIPESGFFYPALSSVHQNIIDLGAQAVEQIMNAIESRVIHNTYPPATRVIQPELVIRASSLASQRIERGQSVNPIIKGVAAN